MPGDTIVVRHYSLLNVFRSAAIESADKSLFLKISREQSNAYFYAGDPIVLAIPGSENIRISGGRVLFYNQGEGTLQVQPDIRKVENDVRRYERTPVSHYADIRLSDTGKKYQVLVKDISYYGVMLFTKADLYNGQQMDVDVFLDRDIMSLKAEVVRNHQGAVHTEYGLKILHRGPLVFNYIQNYVRKSQEEFMNAFSRK
jgi:hypothetical protein